jgi:hypothetical protein
MGYLGYKPADKPLTAADITDSIITSAKITDATIVNGDIANATIALAKLSATGTPSAATFLRGDNSWGSAGAAAGQVIQVVNAEFDGSVSITGSVAATGIIASITPSATSSKILVMITLGGMRNSGTAPSYCEIYLYRKIGGGSYSNFNQLEGGFFYTPSGMYTTMNFARNVYDTTHNTTSQIDYQIYMKVINGSLSVNIDGVESSTITLLEVKG